MNLELEKEQEEGMGQEGSVLEPPTWRPSNLEGQREEEMRWADEGEEGDEQEEEEEREDDDDYREGKKFYSLLMLAR